MTKINKKDYHACMLQMTWLLVQWNGGKKQNVWNDIT